MVVTNTGSNHAWMLELERTLLFLGNHQKDRYQTLDDAHTPNYPFLGEGSEFFDCSWSLLCHGTARNKEGGVTTRYAKPHMQEGS